MPIVWAMSPILTLCHPETIIISRRFASAATSFDTVPKAASNPTLPKNILLPIACFIKNKV
ncbi:MAG: hypothetical protein SPF41_07340 [Candidatus Merdousia sp.]|nr:hypothetical protein [Candidatus Merdousia sp.]